MKIIGRPRLIEFMGLHSEARNVLQAWTREVEVASWKTKDEIAQRYQEAEFTGKETVVFRFYDHRFRLTALLNFSAQSLLIVKVACCKPADGEGRAGEH